MPLVLVGFGMALILAGGVSVVTDTKIGVLGGVTSKTNGTVQALKFVLDTNLIISTDTDVKILRIENVFLCRKRDASKTGKRERGCELISGTSVPLDVCFSSENDTTFKILHLSSNYNLS